MIFDLNKSLSCGSELGTSGTVKPSDDQIHNIAGAGAFLCLSRFSPLVNRQ